jgi:hypothetical protein
MYWVRLVGGDRSSSRRPPDPRLQPLHDLAGARRTTRRPGHEAPPSSDRQKTGPRRPRRRTPTTTPSTASSTLAHGFHHLAPRWERSPLFTVSPCPGGGRRLAVRDHPDVPRSSRTCPRSPASSPTRRSSSSAATSTSARAATTATRRWCGRSAETERYGEYSKAGEFVYDHPFQWGSRASAPTCTASAGSTPPLARAAHGGSARHHRRLDHAGLPVDAAHRLDFDSIEPVDASPPMRSACPTPTPRSPAASPPLASRPKRSPPPSSPRAARRASATRRSSP